MEGSVCKYLWVRTHFKRVFSYTKHYYTNTEGRIPIHSYAERDIKNIVSLKYFPVELWYSLYLFVHFLYKIWWHIFLLLGRKLLLFMVSTEAVICPQHYSPTVNNIVKYILNFILGMFSNICIEDDQVYVELCQIIAICV
jgi:hypothetical protein